MQTTKKKLFISANKPANKIKEIFFEWSQSVTYHCFPKIFKKQNSSASTLSWAFIFIIFSSLTCFILIKNILAYYQFNLVSTIAVINERSTYFPTVTICYSNPFITKEAENSIKDIFMAAEYESLDNLSFSNKIEKIKLLSD